MPRRVDGPEITGQVFHKQTGQAYGPVTVTASPKVYTDPEMSVSVTSLTTDGTGVFSCYAPPGQYTFTTTAVDAATIEPVEVLGHEGGTGTPQSAAYLMAGKGTQPRARRRKMVAASSMLLADGTFAFAGAKSAGSLTDATDYVLGSSAASITTSGLGTFGGIDKTVVWDVSASSIRITFQVTGVPNITTFKLYAGDATLANFFQVSLNPGASRSTVLVVRDGEWVTLDLPRSVFTVGAGAPSWAAIAKVRLFCQDNAAGTFLARENAIGLVPDQTALPNGFAVICLDDADASHWTIAKPYLDKYGSPATACPINEVVDVGASMTLAQLKAARDHSGWEIAGHASTSAAHATGLAGLTTAQVQTEYEAIKAWQATNGFESSSFAWPNGDSDAVSEAAARPYWSCARGTVNAYVQAASVPNPYRLASYNLAGSTLAQAQAYLDKAKSGKAGAIFVAHKITASPGGGNDVATATFQGIVDYCQAQGVPILTLTDALTQLGILSS